MLKKTIVRKIHDIELRIVYSRRRTLGISVLPDSSVVVRVPHRTSDTIIERIIMEKSSWITRHRDNFILNKKKSLKRIFSNGSSHLFMGNEALLKISKSTRQYISFNNGAIDLGIRNPEDQVAVKRLIYKGYKTEAESLFQSMINNVLERYKEQNFRPAGLIVRSMKRRWGSCSSKGVITLSTELIKLPEIYTEYVIIHELCHLKHHNHGTAYYKLLTELFPPWKKVRKEMKDLIS